MAAWEAVAAATVAPAKEAALRCCTEKVKPKCFVCLVKCCGIAATTSGGTTTLAQEDGTQMTPPPSPPSSDQDDDSISSLAFDDGGVDVYEAEPASPELLASPGLSSSDSSASAAGLQIIPGEPGHHCPSCRRSWRAGDPNLPDQGICDRITCGKQELQDGMLGASRPSSMDVDLSLDCICLVCGSDFAPCARLCRGCGSERGAALPEETLPEAMTLDFAHNCKHCQTQYAPNALNCRTCGESRGEGLTQELLLLAHITRKDFLHPDVIAANREQIVLLQTFLQHRFRVWKEHRNRLEDEVWFARAKQRARRRRARPRSQGEIDAGGGSTASGSGACRTPNAHRVVMILLFTIALMLVPTEAMPGPAQLAMYASPFGVTTLAAVFHLCWVG
jgi:ribosomal protein L40E